MSAARAFPVHSSANAQMSAPAARSLKDGRCMLFPFARDSRAPIRGSCLGFRDLQSALDRRPGDEFPEGALDVRETGELHDLARVVETDQVSDPGEGSDVDDGVALAHDPHSIGESYIEDGEQPAGLRDVTIPGPLVFVVLAGEFVKEPYLAEHRTDGAHLKHQPLNRLVAL